ncbi:hypothetical protein [Brevundimonas vesicularis]|uniref:hypothetical protein n=1 Tax=Brevundimonas vesicularis TaxID=41276 RepID=UPI0038D4CC3A
MIRTQAHADAAELELLDEEAWFVPERLSADDCLEQLGADWRWPSAPRDQDEMS